jgi:hypothetical protein
VSWRRGESRRSAPLGLATLLLVGGGATGCREEAAPPLKSLAPAPLPALPTPPSRGAAGDDREALHRLEPAPVAGEPLPEGAERWRVEGSAVRAGARVVDVRAPGAAAALVAGAAGPKRVLLAPDADTFLAQVAPLLAALDDAGAATWLLHPEGRVAYRLRLRDEPAFQAWLDEPVPGRIRVVQRGDGFELTTNVGKLRGPDPNGPSVPLRGGQQDVAGLRRGLTALKGRFGDAVDVCLVPSFGMELARVAEALSGTYDAAGAPLFEERCLVYPRPR